MNTALFINSFYLTLWLIQAVRQLLLWTYWLQVKEYRFDRFKVLFRSETGKRELDFLSIIFKTISLLLLSFLPLNQFTFLAMILFIYLCYLDLRFIHEILKRKFRRPVFTLRIKEIVGISSLLIFLTLVFGQYYFVNFFRVFLFAELMLILGPFVGIFLTRPLVNRAKNRQISKAKSKINKIKPIIIGITGSYGKTTTKEFIYQLLSSENKVSKTPGSHNTEFGLARAISENLKKDQKYFVAEYGAYKRGEITRLKKIASPKIAILTAIEPQHLELFGSMENIRKGKYELFEDLSKGDIAIFNIGNSGAKRLYIKAKRQLKKVKILSYTKISSKKADIVLQKLKYLEKGYKITVGLDSETKDIQTNIKMEFLLENLLPAILLSRKLGLSWQSIKKVCANLKLPKKTMDIKKINKNLTIIDDTHNLTPSAFTASINFLNNYKDHEKIIVTPGMIELGRQSEKYHKKVAFEMKKISIDKLILTKKDSYNVFKEILGSKVIYYNEGQSFTEVISGKGQKVVLLAGRVPSALVNLPERAKNE